MYFVLQVVYARAAFSAHQLHCTRYKQVVCVLFSGEAVESSLLMGNTCQAQLRRSLRRCGSRRRFVFYHLKLETKPVEIHFPFEFSACLCFRACCSRTFLSILLGFLLVSDSMAPREAVGPSASCFEPTTMTRERLEGDVDMFFWPPHSIDAHLSHKRVIEDGIDDADLSEEALLRETMVVFPLQLTTGLRFPLSPLVHDLCTILRVPLMHFPPVFSLSRRSNIQFYI